MATALKPGVTETRTGTVPDDEQSADRPDITHPAYDRMQKRAARCRALWGGTDDIRDGEEDYLPRLEGESDESYNFRRVLCAVTNAFKRTVKACVGLLFETRPTLGEDMPSELVAFGESVDGERKHFAVFLKELATEALIDGHAGILTEYPRVTDAVATRPDLVSQAAVDNPAALSADDTNRLGLRPYWIKVVAADVIKQVYSKVNGSTKLVLLIIRETSEERVGRFGLRTVKRYRVYERLPNRVTCQVWKAVSGQVPTPEDTAPIVLKNLKEIPWSPLIAGEVISKVETTPPLLDLADLNIEHHQVKTEIRNLASLACVPTIKRKGAQAQPDPDDPDTLVFPPITLGPRNTIEVPADGDAEWMSPPTDVLEDHRLNLQDIKTDMGAAGMAFLAPDTRAAETAEAKRIDSAAQNATLGTFASNVKDCAESAFGHAGAYGGVKAGSVSVNTDFENTVMDATTMQAYGYLASIGKLSIETLLAALERGKRLPEGFDVDEEIRRILKEGALPPDPNRPPNDNNPPTDNAGGAQ
jgi:hypothetical protein